MNFADPSPLHPARQQAEMELSSRRVNSACQLSRRALRFSAGSFRRFGVGTKVTKADARDRACNPVMGHAANNTAPVCCGFHWTPLKGVNPTSAISPPAKTGDKPHNETSGAAAGGCFFMLSLFSQSEQLPSVSDHWCLTRDGDPFGYELARRHYSARNYREQRQRLFVGPGRKLVLLSKDGKALFVWRRFVDDTQPPQTGHNCALFRNEGPTLSSLLIREAVAIVFDRWGRDRCYTLVNSAKVRSTNPGCCFKKAGWSSCGTTKTGKLIFELFPTPAASRGEIANEHEQLEAYSYASGNAPALWWGRGENR